nr:MAG TPA: hypothetical protein [Caudoviricetes sp.]
MHGRHKKGARREAGTQGRSWRSIGMTAERSAGRPALL